MVLISQRIISTIIHVSVVVLNKHSIEAKSMSDTNQGTLKERYDIYVSCMEGTGEYIKSFDEWLNS